MGRRLGLIIGINSYQDATFQPLRFAETDARALAQWLVHTRGGNWNPGDVQVVLGAEASRELIENLITSVCLHMATAEDLVLIYFAGYAFIDQANGDGYLAATNTRYQQSGSGIHFPSLIGQIMTRSTAAQILCILDCFQFGQVWNASRGSQFDYRPLFGSSLQHGLQQTQGRVLYCSCRGNDTAPEVSSKNLGSFMYHLIMGVGGPATEQTNGQITLQRLHVFLTERLSEQQRPQIFGQELRPIILVGEMPSFKSGPLNGARASGMLPPLDPSGSPAVQAMPMAGPMVAQLSPSPPSAGQSTMTPLEQHRLQQCQQMIQQARQLVQIQNFQQAYQLIEAILQIQPAFIEAIILKAQILGTMGQFQEALNTIRQVVENAPENALGWSMAAALLANLGQFPDAMSAADRSLSLDPTNTETISLKAMIREKLAENEAHTGKRSRLLPPIPQKPGDPGKSFALAAGIQLLALLLGLSGAFLPLLVPSLPKIIAFLFESIALALLLVNAWRGAYLYGLKRFLLTLLCSLLTLGILGAFASGLLGVRYAIKPTYTFLMNHVSNSYTLMTPLVIMLIWLTAAALGPTLAGLLGFITGMIVRARSGKAT